MSILLLPVGTMNCLLLDFIINLKDNIVSTDRSKISTDRYYILLSSQQDFYPASHRSLARHRAGDVTCIQLWQAE